MLWGQSQAKEARPCTASLLCVDVTWKMTKWRDKPGMRVCWAASHHIQTHKGISYTDAQSLGMKPSSHLVSSGTWALISWVKIVCVRPSSYQLHNFLVPSLSLHRRYIRSLLCLTPMGPLFMWMRPENWDICLMSWGWEQAAFTWLKITRFTPTITP